MMKSQNWFQRHPSGTAILAMLLAFILAGVGSLDVLEDMTVGLGALIFHFVDWLDTRELVFALIGLAMCLPILGWMLKQKKASLWLILVAFLPFGWVVFPFIGYHGFDEILHLKHWTGSRQALCLAGIAATIVLIILASRYELPILERYLEPVESDSGVVSWHETVIKDYSHAPLWVRIGSEHAIILVVIDGFLLYGALRSGKYPGTTDLA